MTESFSLPSWLKKSHLKGMRRGIEKESLRMRPDGHLSQTAHPRQLGSKLMHPYITTDYSESLLELITKPKSSIDDVLAELTELHSLVFDALREGELLWPMSMPCMLSSNDEDIPLADFGSANIAKLKTLYRHGLGMRYGRRMQTIAGLHYNISFPDIFFESWRESKGLDGSLQEVKNQAYLGLVRNFKRLTVMVLYLLGASPSVCACFLIGRKHHLKPLNSSTLYLPDATSLRMGRLGYLNSAQDDLDIYYNNLNDYVTSLRKAVSISHPPFAALGVDDARGNPVQINDHILQIENEYYSSIRPKQVAFSGEAPTQALKQRGIAYIELRAVDLDPFSSIGISLESAHFLETLALHCLLKPSPPIYADEESVLSANQEKVVNAGRDRNMMITTRNGQENFRDWMARLLEEMQPVAQMLDAVNNTVHFSSSLETMFKRVKDSRLTPSAKVLEKTRELGSTWKVGSQLAAAYAKDYEDYRMTVQRQDFYDQLAQESIKEQEQLEAENDIPFYEFVQQYR